LTAPRHLLPGTGLGPTDRHVRRPVDGRRLQGACGRQALVRSRLFVRSRYDRHRRFEEIPRPSAVGQLDEGLAHRALSAGLFAIHLSQESVPGAAAVHSRPVPQGSDRTADRADARARYLATPLSCVGLANEGPALGGWDMLRDFFLGAAGDAVSSVQPATPTGSIPNL